MHLQPLGFYLFSPSIKMSIRKLQSLFVCQQTNVTFLWIQIETFVFPVKTMTWIKCCLYFLQLFDRIFNSTVNLCICRSGRGELHRCGQKLRLNCCSGKTIAGKSQEPEHLQSGSSVFFNLKKNGWVTESSWALLLEHSKIQGLHMKPNLVWLEFNLYSLTSLAKSRRADSLWTVWAQSRKNDNMVIKRSRHESRGPGRNWAAWSDVHCRRCVFHMTWLEAGRNCDPPPPTSPCCHDNRQFEKSQQTLTFTLALCTVGITVIPWHNGETAGKHSDTDTWCILM